MGKMAISKSGKVYDNDPVVVLPSSLLSLVSPLIPPHESAISIVPIDVDKAEENALGKVHIPNIMS